VPQTAGNSWDFGFGLIGPYLAALFSLCGPFKEPSQWRSNRRRKIGGGRKQSRSRRRSTRRRRRWRRVMQKPKACEGTGRERDQEKAGMKKNRRRKRKMKRNTKRKRKRGNRTCDLVVESLKNARESTKQNLLLPPAPPLPIRTHPFSHFLQHVWIAHPLICQKICFEAVGPFWMFLFPPKGIQTVARRG